MFDKVELDDDDGGHTDVDGHYVHGPVLRNMIFMNDLNKGASWKHELSTLTDKEQKATRNALKLMVDEFNFKVDKPVDGIAFFIFSPARLTKGMASGLIIFHLGQVLHLETLSKTKARFSWEDPLDNTDLLKLKELKTNNQRWHFGASMLWSILGHGRDVFHAWYLPQDSEVFSHYEDPDYSSYCWVCRVSLRKLKKSVCAGCLRARYCTLECQGEDRDATFLLSTE